MKKVYSIILSSYTILMSSLMNLNGGTLDATNSNLIVNSSNIIFPQNSDISSNKFTITNSSISVKNLNTTLGLNNSWTGTNTFTKDVSFNNTKTQISSTGVIGLSGGIINISGGIVNIAGPTTIGGAWATSLAGDTTITSNNIYLNNIPLTSDLSCITYNPATKRIGYVSLPQGQNYLPLNNTWTGTNTFTNDVSLNSNVYAGALASTPSDTNCVSFNPSTKKLGYTAIPALLPSNNTWTGTNTFNNNVSFNNTTTQINSTSVVGLSGGVINISGGTVNIAGVTTHSQNTYVLGGVGIGKNSVSSGYALDVSGSAIINNGKVGIGTTDPSFNLHVVSNNYDFGIEHSNTDRSIRIGTYVGGSLDGGYIGTITNKPFCLYTNNSGPRLTVGTDGNVGIGKTNPSSALDVSGTISTDKMLLRTPDYSTQLVSQTYTAGTWYTAIDNNILVEHGIYIITLNYYSGTTPWYLYTAFMHYSGLVNDGASDGTNNRLSGAAVPTSIHAQNSYLSNTDDYQIFIRGKMTLGNKTSGVEFKINRSTVGTGNWNVKAYRII